VKPVADTETRSRPGGNLQDLCETLRVRDRALRDPNVVVGERYMRHRVSILVYHRPLDSAALLGSRHHRARHEQRHESGGAEPRKLLENCLSHHASRNSIACDSAHFGVRHQMRRRDVKAFIVVRPEDQGRFIAIVNCKIQTISQAPET
jgi:hypothetical protein